MLLRHAFEDRLARDWPPARWLGQGVVIGLSGGADSMALAAALAAVARGGAARGATTQSESAQSEPAQSASARSETAADERGDGRLAAPLVAAPLVAAHFNHRLRGAESDADAEFVVAAAAELEIRSVVGSGDVIGRVTRDGDGIEAAARAARYDFLADVAARFGCRYVATAHTLDDQAETVLHRLLRGTGPAGLAGIPRVRPLVPQTVGLVRPLLAFRRSEVRDYLRDRGLAWREDSSNDELRFTRNRIRRELLPLLAAEYNPRVIECLARLAGQADEYRAIVDELVTPVYRRAVVEAGGGTWTIDCPRLAGAPPLVVRELFVRVWSEAELPAGAMGYDDWSALAAMAGDPHAPPRDLPGNVAVRREGDRLTAAQR